MLCIGYQHIVERVFASLHGELQLGDTRFGEGPRHIQLNLLLILNVSHAGLRQIESVFEVHVVELVHDALLGETEQQAPRENAALGTRGEALLSDRALDLAVHVRVVLNEVEGAADFLVDFLPLGPLLRIEVRLVNKQVGGSLHNQNFVVALLSEIHELIALAGSGRGPSYN